MKRFAIALAVLSFIGCASFNYRIVGWYNVAVTDPIDKVLLNNGETISIVGNPRITCYSKSGRVLADGLFVKVEGEYLVVDEFGKQYVWIQDNDLGNYCKLWEQK